MKSPIKNIIACHGNLASGCSQRICSSNALNNLEEQIIRIRDMATSEAESNTVQLIRCNNIYLTLKVWEECDNCRAGQTER